MQTLQTRKHELNRGCLLTAWRKARWEFVRAVFLLHMIYQHFRIFTKWIKRKAVQSFNYFTWIFLKFKKKLNPERSCSHSQIKFLKNSYFENDCSVCYCYISASSSTLKKKTHQILGRKPEICHLLSHQKSPRHRGVLPKTWQRRGCPCTCEGGPTDSGMTSSTWSTQGWAPTQAADSPGPQPQPQQVAEQSPYLWADIPCVYIYLLQFFTRIIFKP